MSATDAALLAPAPAARPAELSPLGATARRPGAPWARPALLALAALAGLWALASLTWPLGTDLSVYAGMGDVVRRGGMPYRDGWDMKGPLVPYLYALGETLSGGAVWGIRLLDLAVFGAGTWALAGLVRRWASPRAAAWAAVLYVLAYGSTTYNETAQPDAWVPAFLLLALAALGAERRPALGRYLAAGACVGCCALIKPFYAGFLLVPALHAWLAGGPAAGRLARAAAAGVGLALPAGVAAAWFAAHGALDDLLEVHLLYSSRVYSGAGRLALGRRVAGVFEYFWREGKIVPVALPAVVAGGVALWRARRREAAVLLVWGALAVAWVALQNKWYPYHWHPLLPVLVILGAVGLHAVIAGRFGAGTTASAASAAPGRVLAAALLGVVAVHAAVRPAVYVARAALYATGRLGEGAYYAAFVDAPGFVPLDNMRAARYIRARTKPEDRVGVWGMDAGVPYLAGRRPFSRLGAWYWPVATSVNTAVAQAYRREYLAAFRATPPTYYVVHARPERGDSGSAGLWRGFDELRDLVERDYRLERTVGSLRLYRRVAGASSKQPAAVPAAVMPAVTAPSAGVP